MARKGARRFRRIKEEAINSNFVLTIRTALRKTSVRIILGVIIAVLLIVGIYLFNRFKTYDGFSVDKSIKVDSGTGSKIVSFGEFAVKYSEDGVSYIDGEETVWANAHEMKTPIVDACQGYLAIADKNTNDIFIYTEEGKSGSIRTSYPIIKMEVAEQGVVAALLQEQQANYIEVYNSDGKQLVSHKTLIQENGYPIDFSLSDDGTQMVVSYLTISDGTLKTKIKFYNFSNVGKNTTDRVIAQFDHYEDVIVPKVQFVNGDDVIAVGENVLSFYSAGRKPSLKEEIEVKEEIEKIFYNEEYVGFVLKNDSNGFPHKVKVYDLSGNEKMDEDLKGEYDNVKLAGENILLYNDLDCRIVSFNGVTKLEYTFKEEIKDIIPLKDSGEFLIMNSGEIEKVQLD